MPLLFDTNILIDYLRGREQAMDLLTAQTEVKSHKRGVFRGSKEYAAGYILRGLRLEVDGVGNADGQIVADKIRFDEQDLRAAQALKSTVDPLEAEMNEKLKKQQEEQERLAGQIAENQALTEQARAEAAKAQQTADYANNRINGLDDFDTLKTITVPFASGSATLGPKAKATIDEAAAWVKTQNTKGWVMAVVGYADSTGNSQRNIDLSERRANAVIYYIVNKYKMSLNRLVQPFGYGQLEPVAENKTKATEASVDDYIASRANEEQRVDCKALMSILKRVTKQRPKMWGPSIVGYGAYRYTYESGRTGEAPLAGFAIRGRELVLYVLAEDGKQKSLLSKLGKHRRGKVCLYFKQLADLDKSILEQLVIGSITEARRRYG